MKPRLPHDELMALVADAVEVLDTPFTRAAVCDLEQGFQDRVSEELIGAAIDGSLSLDVPLGGDCVPDLHARLYGGIGEWAGRWRKAEVNIGVAPERIAVELRGTLGTIAFRWEHTDDWTARQLGITVHAETVRIHPFADGDGCTTTLFADLVFAAAQDPTL